MGKSASNAYLDAPFDYLIANADRQILCSAEPTSYAQATTTFALADVALAGGDFTKADGDVSGRKVTIAAKNGVAVDANGTGNHVAIVDDTASALILVTTVPTPQAVSVGGTVDFASYKDEIADPA